MIFPSCDRALLTHELGTYGITYSDADDCLVIAPKLKERPTHVGNVTGVPSPCQLVCVLSYETEFVGAMITSVSQLICYFWNGNVPEDIPVHYLLDMVDLCLFDLQIRYGIENDEFLLQARDMHALARELMRGSGSLPQCILERIRDHIEESYTVH